MGRLRIFILVACLSVAVVCLSGCDGTEPEANNSSGGKANVGGLTTENLKDREKAAEAIRKEHSKLIQQLITFSAEKVERLDPKDPKSPYPWHDSKHLAILLLGDLRAVQAIPVLFNNLEYKNPKTPWTHVSWEEGDLYPAAGALVKIGVPAVEPAIDRLATEDEEGWGRRLCCWVIKKVLGTRLGKLRLQMAIEETRDPTVKKNLTATLPYFKTEQEKAAEERARRKKPTG